MLEMKGVVLMMEKTSQGKVTTVSMKTSTSFSFVFNDQRFAEI